MNHKSSLEMSSKVPSFEGVWCSWSVMCEMSSIVPSFERVWCSWSVMCEMVKEGFRRWVIQHEDAHLHPIYVLVSPESEGALCRSEARR
jgi:hypothetical protein